MLHYRFNNQVANRQPTKIFGVTAMVLIQLSYKKLTKAAYFSEALPTTYKTSGSTVNGDSTVSTSQLKMRFPMVLSSYRI
jgi:hypothetical protein